MGTFRAGLDTSEGGDILTDAEIEDCWCPADKQVINLETNRMVCRVCGKPGRSLNPFVSEKLRVA